MVIRATTINITQDLSNQIVAKGFKLAATLQFVAYSLYHNIFSLIHHFGLTKEKKNFEKDNLKTKILVATIEVSVTIA